MFGRRLASGAARAAVSATPAAALGAPAALATSAGAFGAANALGFGISLATGSHLHLDLIGTGVFALAALSLRGTELRQRLSAGAIALWSSKLAAFLFYRACAGSGRDARLEETLSTTSGAAGFWTISFLWGFVVSLPHTLAAGVPLSVRPPPTPLLTGLSLLSFGIGFCLETAADIQKYWFKSNPANKGKFCDTGVWSISQHPNYAGNLLVWTAITALNAPTLLSPAGGLATGWFRLLASCASPIFMISLFYAQATGAMGNTVELAKSKYGFDPRYQEYVEQTPLVIPTIHSIQRALGAVRRPGGKPEL